VQKKIIGVSLRRSGLTNKHARLYILRHSRATHLAKHLTEAQMCTFFGWVLGTQVFIIIIMAIVMIDLIMELDSSAISVSEYAVLY
jgi:hypothetical protein